MRRVPVAAWSTGVIGFASSGLGIWLVTKACTDRCYERPIGAAFIAFGFVAILALLPNAFGFGFLCGALTLALFLGLVFLFATRWAGIFPPLLLIGIALAERASIKRYYLRAP